MKLALQAALATLCLAANPIRAAETQTYAQCQHAAAGVTIRLQACNATELAQQDFALNQTYQAALAALPAARQERLRAAERSWLAFADAECAFQTSAESGGSDAPLLHDSCRLSLTSQRIAQLQQALKVAHAQN